MRRGVLNIVWAIVLTASQVRGASMLDPTFNIGTGANWYVEHMLEQPDGKILACGLLSKLDGKPFPYIGRLNPDGSIDETFKAAPNYWVRHIILLPDGKILIGGMFTQVSGSVRRLIARLNPDGSLDQTFNPGRGGEVSIGTGINNDPTPFIIWMDIQPDGKILATGNFGDYDGANSSGIVRINPDGSRDASFNVGAGINTWGRFVKVWDNSQIIISGWFTSYNNRSFNRLVRVNSDGSYDPSLSAFYGDKTSVYTVFRQPDGKLLTAGHSLNDQGLFKTEIVRLNMDGSVDPTFPTHTNEKIESIYPLPDGRLLLVGEFTRVNDVFKPCIARINPDGTLDPTVHANMDGIVWNVTQTHDKKLLVCGTFSYIDGVTMNCLARLILPEDIEQPPPPPPPLSQPVIANLRVNGSHLQCDVESANGITYALQYSTNLDLNEWTSLPDSVGNGSTITLEDTGAQGTRFYRVQARRTQ